MRKIICLVIVGVLVFSGLGAFAGTFNVNEKFISEAIVFSQPDILYNQDFVSVKLSEANTYSFNSGKPMLPMLSKVYTFPCGTIIYSVEVTFSKTIEIVISKPIEPSQQWQDFSINSNNKITIENEPSYADIDVYPEQRYDYRVGCGLDDGERVIFLTVLIQPVQYKPNENLLMFSEIANIDITYTLPEKPVTFGDDYDLLILAPSEFESALQRLVDHKNSLEPPVRTILVTLDEIPTGVGVDVQEDIKYFIKDAIETWGITYVLLVGAGVEGEEIFPVRYVWLPSPPYENYFPSDLYFADIYNATMGFSDWDVDEDGKYCEYSTDIADVDIHPDVYLGKIPCNDVKELNIVIDKIIYYKEHNAVTNRILQMGADSLPGDSVYEGEYANGKVMDTLPTYTANQLWGTNGKLTKRNIGKGFRVGVDFVDFSGHGNPNSWATHPPDDDTVWIPPKTIISFYEGFLYIDVDLYIRNNQKKYPIVVFTACSNNKYSKTSDCIGWHMLKKKNAGSIATFAESGIGLGPGGSQFVTVGIGWLEVNIFKNIYDSKSLGIGWADTINGYYSEHGPNLDGQDYQTMVEFSMFGDPTVIVDDGDDPVNIPYSRPTIFSFFESFIGNFPILSKIIEKIVNN